MLLVAYGDDVVDYLKDNADDILAFIGYVAKEYGEPVVAPATCTTPATKTYTCTDANCTDNTLVIETAPALGHTTVVDPAVDPTYSEEGSTYLMTNAADRYLMDESLDVIYKELDPTRFFRISRSCIVSSKSVGQVVKKLGNRLKLTLKPASNIDSFVSRAKTADFMEWLEKGSM